MTTDIPTRRRRPLLALVGGALLVFTVLLLLLIIVPIGPPLPDATAYVFSFAAVALPAGMGYWLLRLGAPDLAESLKARLFALGRVDAWRRAATRTYGALALTRPRLLASPLRLELTPAEVRRPISRLGEANADLPS